MISRNASSWQLILADLSLILFLLTLSALANESGDGSDDTALDFEDDADATHAEFASSQALFRATPSGPTIQEWLSEQPLDPRATLTVFAVYAPGEEQAVWEQAQVFAKDASDARFAVRVVITSGDVNDIYASLAYDAPTEEQGSQKGASQVERMPNEGA
ncbi:MAG: hypothetical protein ABJN35_10980 [Erythrobacter sp.]